MPESVQPGDGAAPHRRKRRLRRWNQRRPHSSISTSTTRPTTARPTTTGVPWLPRRPTVSPPERRRPARRRSRAARTARLPSPIWPPASGRISRSSCSATRVGQTAGFYLKAIEIAPDLSQFRVYYTSIARANASLRWLHLRSGLRRADAGSAETLARDFPSATAADFAPLEARLIDEATYVEQGMNWGAAHQAYLRYIIEELGVEPDLLLLGVAGDRRIQPPVPRADDARPNPTARPTRSSTTSKATARRTACLEQREGYIRSAYEMADATLANRP